MQIGNGSEQYFKHAISVLNNFAREADRDTKSFEIGSSIIFSVADKHQDAIDAAVMMFYSIDSMSFSKNAIFIGILRPET